MRSTSACTSGGVEGAASSSRTPHGSFFTYQTTFRLTHPVSAVCIALGQHTRAGIEDRRAEHALPA